MLDEYAGNSAISSQIEKMLNDYGLTMENYKVVDGVEYTSIKDIDVSEW